MGESNLLLMLLPKVAQLITWTLHKECQLTAGAFYYQWEIKYIDSLILFIRLNIDSVGGNKALWRSQLRSGDIPVAI